jgi:hypothetical protein
MFYGWTTALYILFFSLVTLCIFHYNVVCNEVLEKKVLCDSIVNNYKIRLVQLATQKEKDEFSKKMKFGRSLTFIYNIVEKINTNDKIILILNKAKTSYVYVLKFDNDLYTKIRNFTFFNKKEISSRTPISSVILEPKILEQSISKPVIEPTKPVSESKIMETVPLDKKKPTMADFAELFSNIEKLQKIKNNKNPSQKDMLELQAGIEKMKQTNKHFV